MFNQTCQASDTALHATLTTIQSNRENNKGADQTEQMRRLICCSHAINLVFSRGPYLHLYVGGTLKIIFFLNDSDRNGCINNAA